MLAKINRRMKSDEGFTLIELLIVLVIIGILVAIAIPSYLGFRGRAQEGQAESNVRSATPSAEAFFSDNQHYDTTAANLKTVYDSGLATGLVYFGTNAAAAAQSYCISFTVGPKTAKIVGPGGTVVKGDTTAVAACTSATG